MEKGIKEGRNVNWDEWINDDEGMNEWINHYEGMNEWMNEWLKKCKTK